MTVIAAARGLAPTLDAVEQQAARWLARHSVDLLRISLGLVFFGFGVLKFFPVSARRRTWRRRRSRS